MHGFEYAREQQAGREREHQAQRTADHIFFGHGEPDADVAQRPPDGECRQPAPGQENHDGKGPGRKFADEEGVQDISGVLENSDQLGPLSGYISLSPRISVPGLAGIRQAFISVAASSIGTVTLVTSQTEQPWK